MYYLHDSMLRMQAIHRSVLSCSGSTHWTTDSVVLKPTDQHFSCIFFKVDAFVEVAQYRTLSEVFHWLCDHIEMLKGIKKKINPIQYAHKQANGCTALA